MISQPLAGLDCRDVNWHKVRWALHKAFAFVWYKKSILSAELGYPPVELTKCKECFLHLRREIVDAHSAALSRKFDLGAADSGGNKTALHEKFSAVRGSPVATPPLRKIFSRVFGVDFGYLT